MHELNRTAYRNLGKHGVSEQLAVEGVYRATQEWIEKYYGPMFRTKLHIQELKLVNMDVPQALGLSTQEYLRSLPKLDDQPWTKISQEIPRTEFSPFLVEKRVPFEKLLTLTGFTFPQGMAEVFAERFGFPARDETGDPEIIWSVENDHTKPQKRIIWGGVVDYSEINIGVFDAINFTLQSDPYPEGVRAQVGYDASEIFGINNKSDELDYIDFGYEAGKPFVRVEYMPQAEVK